MTIDPKKTPPEATTTWFDQMTGFLDWEVIGPNVHDPFNLGMPMHQLRRMSKDRNFLCEHISIKCLCDGYEVMVMQNPAQPRIISDHPCISKTGPKDIVAYMKKNAVDVFIWQEIDKLQVAIQEVVNKRPVEDTEEQSAGLADRSKKDPASTPTMGPPIRLVKH